jgi:hypothetical protein
VMCESGMGHTDMLLRYTQSATVKYTRSMAQKAFYMSRDVRVIRPFLCFESENAVWRNWRHWWRAIKKRQKTLSWWM